MLSRMHVRSAGVAAGLAPLAALVLLAANQAAWGSGAAENYFVDVWTPENGLPDSSVSAIAQTPDGYLWVGTHNGLARFDGERFVTFDPANTPALLHARVRKLSVDSQGTLWINTYDGSLTTLRQGTLALERRNLRASEAELTLVPASSNQAAIFLTSRGGLLRKALAAPAGKDWEELAPPIRGLGALGCEDGSGMLWYRDCAGHLWRLAAGKFELSPCSDQLAGQSVNCLTTDARGRLWAGTDQGIEVWDGTAFQTVTPTNAEASVNITFLSITAEDRIWAVANGTMRQAIRRRWTAGPELLPLTNDLSRIGMQEDHHGGIWFYNFGHGLLRLSAGGQVEQITPEDGFPGEHVNCMFEDREGNWWAGLDAGGLALARPRRFHAIGTGGGARVAKSVCEDADGAVWIGTLGGDLTRWRNEAITNLAVSDGAGMGSVSSVCPDAHGRLWVSAGEGEELFVGQGGGFKRVLPAVQGVKAILASHANRIWAGTTNGLFFADGDPPGEFQPFKGIARHYVRALAEDGAGTVWAGAGNGDLYRITQDAVTMFHSTDSQRSEAIWSVLPDKDGTIWVGTFRGGLLCLRNGQFTRFDKKDGLPDNVICQVLDDGQGNLWLGSHQGILQVAKSGLEEVARGGGKLVPCIAYGRSDGLPSLECSGGCQPAAWRGRDGKLWFTTLKGAVWIQPEEVSPNPIAPPVVIEEVLVDGQAQSIGKTNAELPALDRREPRGPRAAILEISPGKHQLELRYTGLSLVSPERVQFRYQMEGVDADWVQAGTQRFAQYNFLPPGDYRFHVIACNSDGVWNQEGSVLGLRILPHLYERLWFRLLAGLAIAGAVSGLIRRLATRQLRRKMEQLQRQQAVERERTRIAKDLHDDLGASLTLIAVLGDLAKKEKTSQRIEKMSSTAREAIKSLDEIVWAVNPGNDTLAHLIDYAGQFATDYLRAAGIRCRLDVPEQTPARELPANVRHNVFLVIKEALQNIVKHAQAAEVWLRISATARQLRVVIEDNGRGFERAPENAWADGLRNMRQRLAEISGRCEIQSVAGAGTTITIELPWPPGSHGHLIPSSDDGARDFEADSDRNHTEK